MCRPPIFFDPQIDLKPIESGCIRLETLPPTTTDNLITTVTAAVKL